MRLLHRFREMLASTAVTALAQADQVVSLVPHDADHVSAGSFLVLPDALAFVGGVPGRQPYRRAFGWAPPASSGPEEAGLLVLRGQRLSLLDRGGERWSVDATQITDLDGHRHTGFVIIPRTGPGLALSFQVPVQVPPGARWTSVPRTTNTFSGWDEVLRPFGARVHW